MSTVSSEDLAGIDLSDPALWDEGVPYELFHALQREDPVHFSAQAVDPDEGGFWSIVRHEDVHAVSRDFETFSSEKRGIFLVDDIGVELDVQRLQMISMDPPRHARMKKLVGKAFTPGRVAHHEEAIRAIVNGVLDRVADLERFDLVADMARPIPARVIGSMLGTPEEDDEQLVHWTNVFTAFEDPEIREQWEDTNQILFEVMGYVMEHIEERRANPRDDLLTALMEARVDGEELDEGEIAVFFILLMAAGNDSTRATYSGIMKSLMEHPEQMRMLIDDPSLIPHAVEEGLRCYPAFAFMARAATKDVQLRGKTIREGDRVLLWYLASNRDPEVWEDPDRFDITRTAEEVDRHQAFGAGGRHFCLGAGLARLELRVWLEETLKRFAELELDGEPNRVRALFLNQYNSIPVRNPAAAAA